MLRTTSISLAVLVAFACSASEQPLAGVRSLPMHRLEGTLPARGARTGELAPIAFSIELPTSYALREPPPPNDSLGIHSFADRNRELPSFTVRRTIGGDAEDPARGLIDDGRRTMRTGTHGDARYAVELRRTNIATSTVVHYVRPTPNGHIFCSGHSDTFDPTPIEAWLIERCASIEAR